MSSTVGVRFWYSSRIIRAGYGLEAGEGAKRAEWQCAGCFRTLGVAHQGWRRCSLLFAQFRSLEAQRMFCFCGVFGRGGGGEGEGEGGGGGRRETRKRRYVLQRSLLYTLLRSVCAMRLEQNLPNYYTYGPLSVYQGRGTSFRRGSVEKFHIAVYQVPGNTQDNEMS